MVPLRNAGIPVFPDVLLLFYQQHCGVTLPVENPEFAWVLPQSVMLVAFGYACQIVPTINQVGVGYAMWIDLMPFLL